MHIDLLSYKGHDNAIVVKIDIMFH